MPCSTLYTLFLRNDMRSLKHEWKYLWIRINYEVKGEKFSSQLSIRPQAHVCAFNPGRKKWLPSRRPKIRKFWPKLAIFAWSLTKIPGAAASMNLFESLMPFWNSTVFCSMQEFLMGWWWFQVGWVGCPPVWFLCRPQRNAAIRF